MSQEVVDKKFSNHKMKIPDYDTLYFDSVDYPLTILDNQAETDSIVIFLHGSPGSARDFLSFYTYEYGLNDYRLIALERPGYSSASFGDFPVSLSKQVAPMLQYLERFSEENSIFLVSHSYGGAPAGILAAQLPELIDGLLLGAVLIDPESEPVWWFNYIFDRRPFNWLLPEFFSMANKEKMNHASELKKIAQIWSNIECPVYVLHGGSDRIAPPGNIEFARRKFIAHEQVHFEVVKDMNHLIQIQQQQRIAEGVRWLASQ